MSTTTGIRPQGVFATATTMALREMERYVRLPQLIFFTLLQPLLFLLLFSFVIGGAIERPTPPGGGDVDYVNFLLPGILVMGVTFGSAKTGVAAADEIRRGVLDRMRALPVSRVGLLGGRVLADAAHNLFTIGALSLCGMLIGFRPASAMGLLGAIGVLVFFGMGFSWLATTAGLAMKHPEIVQAATIVLLLPLSFLSSTFVPVDTMPLAVRVIALANPVTWVADAARALILGQADVTTVLAALVAAAVFAVVFAVLAIRRLNRL
jgi:ABC transporter DrrB family efflux protein